MIYNVCHGGIKIVFVKSFAGRTMSKEINRSQLSQNMIHFQLRGKESMPK